MNPLPAEPDWRYNVQVTLMLTAVRFDTKQQIIASHATKDMGTFLCPECREVVNFHSGRLVVPHFTHKSYLTCTNSPGETDLHRRAKKEIFESLLRSPRVSGAVLERPFGTVRADIFAVIRGQPVAVEVQVSTLSQDAISYRTSEYAKRGIYVLWILPWTEELDSYRYSPQRFERWLHAAYSVRHTPVRCGSHSSP